MAISLALSFLLKKNLHMFNAFKYHLNLREKTHFPLIRKSERKHKHHSNWSWMKNSNSQMIRSNQLAVSIAWKIFQRTKNSITLKVSSGSLLSRELSHTITEMATINMVCVCMFECVSDFRKRFAKPSLPIDIASKSTPSSV